MLRSLRTMTQTDVPNLLPGIHQKLECARRPALFPEGIPWRGLALAASAALVVLVIALPAYRLKRAARQDASLQLAQIASQAAQYRSQLHVGERRELAIDSLRTQVDFARLRAAEETPLQLASATPAYANRNLKYLQGRDEAEREATLSERRATSQYGQYDGESDDSLEGALRTSSGGITGRLDLEQAALVASSPTLVEEQRPAVRAATPFSEEKLAVLAKGTSAADEAQNAPSKEAKGMGQQEPQGVTELPKSIRPLILASWHVSDLAAAAAQVTEWVSARQGFAVSTNDHHLSITLPAPEVPQFLRQFSEHMVLSEDMVLSEAVGEAKTALTEPAPGSAPSQTLRVAISLELVPIQPTEATSSSTTSSSAQTMQ
jgi:hypothetical protein